MVALQYFVVAVLCLSTANANNPVHLNLDNNFKVDYQINNQSIDFVIEAKATGWVAIGFNSQASMYNADFMMGYINGSQRVVGDYYLLAGATSRTPVPDVVPNWTPLNGSEASGVTKLAARRLLNTNATDATNQDVQLGNHNIVLLWAYHNTNDSVAAMHSVKGSRTLNLFTARSDSGAAIISVGVGTLLVALTAAIMRA